MFHSRIPVLRKIFPFNIDHYFFGLKSTMLVVWDSLWNENANKSGGVLWEILKTWLNTVSNFHNVFYERRVRSQDISTQLLRWSCWNEPGKRIGIGLVIINNTSHECTAGLQKQYQSLMNEQQTSKIVSESKQASILTLQMDLWMHFYEMIWCIWYPYIENTHSIQYQWKEAPQLNIQVQRKAI